MESRPWSPAGADKDAFVAGLTDAVATNPRMELEVKTDGGELYSCVLLLQGESGLVLEVTWCSTLNCGLSSWMRRDARTC